MAVLESPQMPFDPEDKELVLAMLSYRAEGSTRLIRARDAAFPSHVGHGCEENEMVYKHGALSAVSTICSCGYMLEISVEFFR